MESRPRVRLQLQGPQSFVTVNTRGESASGQSVSSSGSSCGTGSSSSSSRGGENKRTADGKLKNLKVLIASKAENTSQNAMSIYRQRCKTWKLGAGSHKSPASAHERVVWLSERKTPTWGVGCSLCAALMVRSKMFDAQQKHNSRRTFTKWAKYGIVSARSMQSCAIRKHAESAVHQAAFRFYFMPASLETLPVNRDADLALLRGSVPQPSDWLQALAAAKESLSSRTAMRLSLTDQFVHSTRACISAITDRAVAQMHTILQETIRGRKRKLLAEASSISLTVDDKSPFRLVRFKAASGKGEVSSGILCLIKPSKMLEDDPEAWDNDKSQLAADSIAAGIKEFCTRLHSDTLDAELYSHILCSIHSFSADGASYAQKVGKLLRRRHCRNIAVIWRDSSHMLRLAAQNPLDGLTVYSNAYEALFGCKGPLPMLQHSHEWRSKLASLSRRMLQDELLGGVLKHGLKHFSWAQQRWESSSVPHRSWSLPNKTFILAVFKKIRLIKQPSQPVKLLDPRTVLLPRPADRFAACHGCRRCEVGVGVEVEMS